MDYKKMAAAFAAGGAVLAAGAAYTMKQKNQKHADVHFTNGGARRVYIQGCTLGSLAAAAYLIRDYNFDGENIHIFDDVRHRHGKSDQEMLPVLANDLWLHEKGYDQFWDLFRSIPSLREKGASVKGEIVAFHRQHPQSPRLTIVRRDKKRVLLAKRDRRLLERLILSKESKLNKVSIQDWFGEDAAFFETDFWVCCRSLFGLKERTAITQLRALLLERGEQIAGMMTLRDWITLPAHPNETLLAPLYSYLKGYGIHIHRDVCVEDVLFGDTYNLRARTLVVNDGKKRIQIELNDDDLCLCTIADSAKDAVYGKLDEACGEPRQKEDLWNRLASHRSELNVAGRLRHPQDGAQGVFLLTLQEGVLLKELLRDNPQMSSDAMLCFADTNWGIALHVPTQPYLSKQKGMVIWGSVLYPHECGDEVRKPFTQCSGKEVLQELIAHLHIEANASQINADLIDAQLALLPFAQAPKLAESEPVFLSPRLSDSNFAVLSPYRKGKACGWLEQQVSAAREAVRMFMGESKPQEENVSLSSITQALQFVRRLG